MPTGRAVGQDILHHQSHRHRDDAVRVVALEWSQIGSVHIKVAFAFTVIMLRIGELNVSRSLGDQVADIAQRPFDNPFAVATSLTPWARSLRKIAAASYDFGFRQVFNMRDSFGPICDIFSRSRHGHPPWRKWSGKYTEKHSPSHCQSAAMLLQSRLSGGNDKYPANAYKTIIQRCRHDRLYQISKSKETPVTCTRVQIKPVALCVSCCPA